MMTGNATQIVDRLTDVAPGVRAAWHDGPQGMAAFRAALAAVPALHQIEVGGPAPQAGGATGQLRVVAWNVERLRHIDPISETLVRLAPDVCLLSEIDKGMARSGNSHRTEDLAQRLGQGYAYGVEFVELGRGNDEERRAAGNVENSHGFHGNAILSRLALQRPALFRLETDGAWWGHDRGQPRVGGRMAMAGQVMLDGQAVTVVTVHLESHSGPQMRLDQMVRLADLVDAYAPGAPVVIGGDLNTSTYEWPRTGRDMEDAADPTRRLRPPEFEPLFDHMQALGYDWQSCNLPQTATQRLWEPDPARRLGQIDWFLTRGLVANAPQVIPATYADGSTASDHEAIMVTLTLRQQR